MGALHAGHISLVDYAKAECDIAVASVFVNPSQFGPNEDFDKYPRTEAADIEKLEAARCDVAFIPSPAEMYPEGFCTWVNVTAAPADRLDPYFFLISRIRMLRYGTNLAYISTYLHLDVRS